MNRKFWVEPIDFLRMHAWANKKKIAQLCGYQAKTVYRWDCFTDCASRLPTPEQAKIILGLVHMVYQKDREIKAMQDKLNSIYGAKSGRR